MLSSANMKRFISRGTTLTMSFVIYQKVREHKIEIVYKRLKPNYKMQNLLYTLVSKNGCYVENVIFLLKFFQKETIVEQNYGFKTKLP